MLSNHPVLRNNIGVIEGFFGRQWNWSDRCDYASFLHQNGYQFYIYAPKGDPFLRQRWREEWPAETIKEIEKLSDVYSREGVKLGIGLSPFELYLDYNENTKKQLQNKIQALNAIGPDILCILFDDMRGDVPDLAQVQSEIIHRIAETSTAGNIIMCPTYYSNDPVLEKVFGIKPDNYLQDLGRLLDREIDIFWTGMLVCSNDYPESHLQKVSELLQRKPFLWDNYPVNDGARKSQFLHLRAFENRSSALRELTGGHAVNPMNQSWLSRIPLQTLIQSYSIGEAYVPQSAFVAACEELCQDSVSALLQEDANTFQDVGLKGLDSATRQILVSRYAEFEDDPYAREIVDWLKGAYEFDPACLTD